MEAEFVADQANKRSGNELTPAIPLKKVRFEDEFTFFLCFFQMAYFERF